MAEELAKRRNQTGVRIKDLRERLSHQAAHRVQDKACVYATGSFGRGEASEYSDLDLFILGKNEGKQQGDVGDKSLLRALDAICLKANLIELTRQMEIPEFSGDGKYLTHYSVRDLTKTLGTSDDDSTNTFTARLLLLLESKSLLEDKVYNQAIADVVDAYWRDYEDHKTDFMPAFLANDILRLWRTFCVNYEARTANVSPREKAKRKLKNFKLKHSRLLTCYSALLYLLARYGQRGSVDPNDVLFMTTLTPTQRLEWLRDQSSLVNAKEIIIRLLRQYNCFLETTHFVEEDLVEKFSDKNLSSIYMNRASEFGDLMFEALRLIGNGSQLYRRLVV